MTDKIVKKTFEYLVKSFLEALDTDYSTAMGVRMILFICFIIILLLSYMVVWLPVMSELNRDVRNDKLNLESKSVFS
jgi:hypothetical protein